MFFRGDKQIVISDSLYQGHGRQLGYDPDQVLLVGHYLVDVV